MELPGIHLADGPTCKIQLSSDNIFQVPSLKVFLCLDHGHVGIHKVDDLAPGNKIPTCF